MTQQTKSSSSEIATADFGKGDIFVLFGELFGRGYATGLVDAAKKAGMTIIGMTVGRRTDDGSLRQLTDEELAQAEDNLGGKIINVPLMAGFDMDAPAGTPTPTDLVNEMTIETWQEHKLDWNQIDACRALGTARFKRAAEDAMALLDKEIPDGANVLFAHTMAGGIPRSKVFLVIANRVYKGQGKRYLPSQTLVESDLGKLILQNFDEVTANTFEHLINASAAIRERVEKAGKQVRYTAYGYHGTRVLINGDYTWQTYTNYTQGFAKMKLEQIASRAWENGVHATVYNCPEIRTNSSDVFAGIELSLLPLLEAVRKEGGGKVADAMWKQSAAMLKDGVSVDQVLSMVSDYQNDPVMQPFYNFEAWPMPNSQQQVDLTVGTSQEIVALHADRKTLISDLLSTHVVNATGQLIFDGANAPEAPVVWLDHDVVACQILAAG
ncbi:MAG: hypothetical protein AAGG69_13250 [Pseudomonadota bacterium]